MERSWALAANVLFLLTLAMTKECKACHNGSSAVADCLHTYLERDFPSIEAIVFPKKRVQKNRTILLLDGPELEDQCRRMEEVVECLEEIQPSCRYYHQFFPYRHLVTALRTTIDWVCSDLRNRFRTLLNSFNCLEDARRKAGSEKTCYSPDIPLNIWQRIVRLQSGTEICKQLSAQVICMEDHLRSCPADGQAVYKELNQVFLKSWCTPEEMAATIRNAGHRSQFCLIPLYQITLSIIVALSLHLTFS